MNKDDITRAWVHNDNMNLCDYCIEACLIGSRCKEFKWNGLVPGELLEEARREDSELFKMIPTLKRFDKDLL